MLIGSGKLKRAAPQRLNPHNFNPAKLLFTSRGDTSPKPDDKFMKIKALSLFPCVFGTRVSLRAALLAVLAALFLTMPSFVNLRAQQPTGLASRQAKWIERHRAWTDARRSSDGREPMASDFMRGLQQVEKMRRGSDQLSMSGEAWSPIGPFGPVESPNFWHVPGVGRINCVTFHPTDPDILWVGVGMGGVWRSDDGGKNWRPLGDALPIQRISDIAVDPRNTDILYVSLGDYAYLGADLEHENRKRHTHFGLGVYKTTDGGLTWRPTGLNFDFDERDGTLIRRVVIHPENSNKLMAAGASGIYHSDDGGDSWTRGQLDEIIWDVEIVPVDSSAIYISTGYLAPQNVGNAAIYKSLDYGATWKKLETPWTDGTQMQRIEIAVARSDYQRVYAIACDRNDGYFGLLRSDDEGDSWRQVSTSPVNIFGGATGDENDIRGQGTYCLSFMVDPDNPDCLYSGGINMWKSANAGEEFEPVSYWLGYYGPSIHADHQFMSYNPLDRKIYVCNDGGLDRTAEIVAGSWNDAFGDPEYAWPTQWEHLSQTLSITSYYRLAVHPFDADYIVAGAQDNGTYVRSPGGKWINVFGGDGMACQYSRAGTQIVYGSAQYGVMYYSESGGEMVNNSFGYDFWNQHGEYGEWTTPFEIDPDDPFSAIIGMRQIWRWNTWESPVQLQQISAFTNPTDTAYVLPATAFDICSGDADAMYVGKRLYFPVEIPNEVHATFDGGKNWRDISNGIPRSLYITDIEVHNNDPRIAWLTLGGFDDKQKVFETRNGGESWQNISGNLPNLPINCVVHDSSSAANTIYVGADIGVYVRNDNSEEWTLYAENIPNVIISDLAINTREKMLYAATFGRGVWEAPAVDLDIPISVDESESNDLIAPTIRPNPGTQFTVALPAHFVEGGSCNYEVVDVMGRPLQHGVLTMREQGLRLSAETAPGVYYLRLNNAGKRAALRFVYQP